MRLFNSLSLFMPKILAIQSTPFKQNATVYGFQTECKGAINSFSFYTNLIIN